MPGADHSPHHTDDRRPLRETWALGWSEARALGLWLVLVIAAFWAVGEIITRVSAIVSVDERVAEWFESSRTDRLDAISPWAAGLSDTLVKVVATAVIAGIMLAVWRRWLDPLVVVVALVFEATAFIVTTYLVGRPRPDVEPLQDSPVDSSFPSGHVAAAMAYLAIAVVLNWRLRHPAARAAVWAAPFVIAFIVAVARMYQGMHFLSDVIAGVVLGLVSVAITVHVMTGGRRDEREPDPSHADHRVIPDDNSTAQRDLARTSAS